MTVKELITKLQELPEDVEVFLYNGEVWPSGYTHKEPNPKLVCQHVNEERYARKYVEL
jgi:hypothetical protein